MSSPVPKRRTITSAMPYASRPTGARGPPGHWLFTADASHLRALSSQAPPARCLLEAGGYRRVFDVCLRRPDRPVGLRVRTTASGGRCDGIVVSRICQAHPDFGLRARRRAFGHGYLWLKPSACDALCTAEQQPQTDRYFHSETAGRRGWAEAVPDFDRDALKRSIQALRSGNPTRHRSVTRANLQPELSAIDSQFRKESLETLEGALTQAELTSASSARRSPAIRRKRLIASPSSDREPRLQSIRSPARPPGRAVASSRCARWPDVRFRSMSHRRSRS
jgi:hypothetical protein